MAKKDPKFKRNLSILAQTLFDYSKVVSTNYDENPDYLDSFAYINTTIITELEQDDDEDTTSPFRGSPIRAA